MLDCSIKFSPCVGEEPSVVQMLSRITGFLGLETLPMAPTSVAAVCEQGAYTPENG